MTQGRHDLQMCDPYVSCFVIQNYRQTDRQTDRWTESIIIPSRHSTGVMDNSVVLLF